MLGVTLSSVVHLGAELFEALKHAETTVMLGVHLLAWQGSNDLGSARGQPNRQTSHQLQLTGADVAVLVDNPFASCIHRTPWLTSIMLVEASFNNRPDVGSPNGQPAKCNIHLLPPLHWT